MNIKAFIKPIMKFGRKHATKILAGGAILTEIAGFYFMHKEAPEVRKKLDQLPPGSTMLDKVKTAAPLYLPAALMLITSSGCIVGGCALGEARVVAATNLAMASEAALTRYQQKVVDTIGQDKANELQTEIAKDLMHERPATQQSIIPTANGTDTFYDPLSGRYFASSESAIYRAKDRVNEIINGIEMEAGVNEWYSALDIPPVGLAKTQKWDIDNKLDVAIDPEWETMPDGRPCRTLVYYNLPRYYDGR